MNISEDLKKCSPILSAAVAAFLAGWGTSEAVMLRAGQDKVVSGTYILLKDLDSEKSEYVKKSDFENMKSDRDQKESLISKIQSNLDTVNEHLSLIDETKQKRFDLEILKIKLQKELQQKIVELALESPMEFRTISEQNNGASDNEKECDRLNCQVTLDAINKIKNEIDVVGQKIIATY